MDLPLISSTALHAHQRNAINALAPDSVAGDEEWHDIPWGEAAPPSQEFPDSGDESDSFEQASNKYGHYVETLHGVGYVANTTKNGKLRVSLSRT